MESIPSKKRLFLLGASPSLSNSGSTPINDALALGGPAEKLRKTGGNTGNQVIAYGLLKSLKFDAVSWDHSIGPARVDAEYDVILVAAANFLHSSFDLGGMASFIEATKLPCAMVGIGAQSNDYSADIKLKPGTERFIRVVSDRTSIIGARGPFTAEVLARKGIHNVQVTGCPSYYMNCKPQLQIRKPPLAGDARLLINGSRDVVSHSFDRERMIEVVCNLISIGIARGADFVAQSETCEIEIADTTNALEIASSFDRILDEFPYFRKIASREDLLSWFAKHTKVFWDVAAWYAAMKNYDFVFGSRFHGNMIALQAGTPACVICHDTRTSEMSEFLGLPFVRIEDIQSINVEYLYDLVDADAIRTRYGQLYPEYKRFLVGNGLETTLE